MAQCIVQERGWQVGKSLQQCLAELLHNQNMTDITLVVTGSDGKSQSFPAHKLILAARSPVFEAMFSGNFSETSKNQVDIIDTEVEAFQEMLRYIYSDGVCLTANNAVHILQLARRYIIDGLVDECTQFLKDIINPENVSEILSQSVAHCEETLSKSCLDVAWSQCERMFKSANFIDMSRDAVSLFLSSDADLHGYFGTDDHLILVAVLKWAEHHSELEGISLRECSGDDIVHNIRYSTLTASQFASLLGKKPMLTCEEMTAWFNYLSVVTDDQFKTALLDQGFYVTPRSSYTTIKRGSRKEIGQTRNCQEVVTLHVRKMIQLKSILVYGGSDGSSHNVSIDIRGEDTEKLCHMNEAFISDGSDKFHEISLPVFNSLELQPSQTYQITATINTDALCYANVTSFPKCGISTRQQSWGYQCSDAVVAGLVFAR